MDDTEHRELLAPPPTPAEKEDNVGDGRKLRGYATDIAGFDLVGGRKAGKDENNALAPKKDCIEEQWVPAHKEDRVGDGKNGGKEDKSKVKQEAQGGRGGWFWA